MSDNANGTAAQQQQQQVAEGKGKGKIADPQHDVAMDDEDEDESEEDDADQVSGTKSCVDRTVEHTLSELSLQEQEGAHPTLPITLAHPH